MSCAVVEAGEGPQGAGDWVGQHHDEGHHPGGGDDLSGVAPCLPHHGSEGAANGIVALDGNGHQVEGGNADRDACTEGKTHQKLCLTMK